MTIWLAGFATAVLWGVSGLAVLVVVTLLVRLLLLKRWTGKARRTAEHILAGRCVKAQAAPSASDLGQEQDLTA